MGDLYDRATQAAATIPDEYGARSRALAGIAGARLDVGALARLVAVSTRDFSGCLALLAALVTQMPATTPEDEVEVDGRAVLDLLLEADQPSA